MKEAHREKLDKLLVAPQYILPQHLLSRIMYHAARANLGALSSLAVKLFARRYDVDMSIAEEPDISAYANFNDFFTRALNPEARPLAPEGIVSPVDGTVSALGRVENESLFQAKGHHYSLDALLGGFPGLRELFKNGSFCTIYLSPRDYHRVHMPLDGKPLDMIYVPGRLFSVSPRTTQYVPDLFARNERIAILFKTAAGPFAIVMVGAIFVGSMETVWEGEITPSKMDKPQRWQLPQTVKDVERGEEIARFNMGSTVILLHGGNKQAWLPELAPGAQLCMGQQIGIE